MLEDGFLHLLHAQKVFISRCRNISLGRPPMVGRSSQRGGPLRTWGAMRCHAVPCAMRTAWDGGEAPWRGVVFSLTDTRASRMEGLQKNCCSKVLEVELR